MFDAKSILDSLVNGAGQRGQQPQVQGGSLGDLLGQVLGGGLQGGRGGQGGGQVGGQGGGGIDLRQFEDMVRNMMPKDGGAGAGTSAGGGTGGVGSLGDILKKLQEQAGGAAGGVGAGSILETLGKVLGQATQGVEEGASKIGQATGARDVFGQMTGGKSPEEILAKLKDLAANNQLATGATLGGLGALVLGTKAGRSLAGGAVKLGAGAMIGGLAYKAYQNYQSGKPLITGRDGGVAAAPAGSGFEPAAQSNESAILFIRTMIAAAAADGRIDEVEQAKIVGALRQAGLDADAEEFLANELNNPASVEDLAAAVRTEQEAVEVYTAARMAIEPDSRGEAEFLARLADVLGIDQKLTAHIDAATRGAVA